MHLRAPLLVLPALLLFVGSHGGAAPVPAENEDKREERLSAIPERDARCNNGSSVKVRLLEDKLTLKTPYGKLVIPTSKIVQIDCAYRLSPSVAKKIEAAVLGLQSDDGKVRDAATETLAKLKAKAYPALVKLEKENEKDAEVQRRIKPLLEELRQSMSEEDQELRPRDVVTTEDSKIAGEIEGSSFRVDTAQFGEVNLKLADLRSLRLDAREPEEKVAGPVLPDPGNLTTYQGHVGKTFVFRVTGAPNGSLWGTGSHTLDSTLALAAVHGGFVKIGETKNLRVKILPAQGAFVGSVKNGISSSGFGPYPGAFEIVKGRNK
ncbi:MAG: hypothetical protein K2W96_02050 [Gemmataceae bacterium]|nr:hypothetical protein [Gemmataceae bacterium]